MTRREYLNALEALLGSFDQWTYDRDRKRYTVTVDDITITVDAREASAQWMVEHANYGVISNNWCDAPVISHARRAAVEYTRAWVNVNIADSVIPA